MKAIILAAGSNNEISDIVGDIPKPLITIEESTILEIQLNTLHACGIDDVSVIKGYKGELIDIPGLKYYNNEKYDSTNILYTLFCAEKEFDDDVLIIYGDIIFDKECLDRILENKEDIVASASISLENYKKDYLEKLEMISLNSDNTIKEIGKKFDNANKSYGQFTGILKCTKKGINTLKTNYKYFKLYNTNYKNALITEMLNNIIEFGIKIPCVLIEHGWIKINNKNDYDRLLNHSEGSPNIFKMKTDWALRAQMYENIKWVNINDTLEEMVNVTNSYDKNSNIKILDIGVGTGKVLKAFKDFYVNSDCYGIDISPDMMEKIDKSYGFNLSVGNAEDLSGFKDNTFDIVTARMSVHHIGNLTKAVSEIKRVLKQNGKIVICEGVPPAKETLEFYKEMFAYKETRNTFLTDDLINLLCNQDFKKVTTRTIILKDMSLNNWLVNAGIPFRNKDIITKMHYNCSDEVKKAYRMKVSEEDILMEWKFVVVCGEK